MGARWRSRNCAISPADWIPDSPADDDVCRVLGRRLGGGVLDGVVDFERVVETLQRERVLAQAVDTEEGGLGAEGDEHVVVIDRRPVREFDRSLVGVERIYTLVDEPRRGSLQRLAVEGDLVAHRRVADDAV